MHRGRRIGWVFSLLGVVLIGVVAAVLADMSGGEGGPRISPGATSLSDVNETRYDVPVGHPVTVSGLAMCLTAHGVAQITSVVPVTAGGGLHVEAYALRPNESARVTEFPGNLAAAGFGTSHVLRDACGPGRENSELGVQVVRPAARYAWIDGVRVWYRSGGHEYTLVYPLRFAVCSSAPDGHSCLPTQH